MNDTSKKFYIYIVSCCDGTLYTGYTNDIPTRIEEHNGLSKKTGAKYTSARRPVKLVYSEEHESKSTAMKREWEIKQMSRLEKIELVDSKS